MAIVKMQDTMIVYNYEKGFICTMYTKNVKTNRNLVSLGQNLKLYANGEEIFHLK